LTPRVALGDTVGEQLVQLVACSLRGRYSRLHGDASSCRRRQPATLGLDSKQEGIPVLFSSKPTPSPAPPGSILACPRFCTYRQLPLGCYMFMYQRDGEIKKRVDIDTEKIRKLLRPQKDFRACPQRAPARVGCHSMCVPCIRYAA